MIRASDQASFLEELRKHAGHIISKLPPEALDKLVSTAVFDEGFVASFYYSDLGDVLTFNEFKGLLDLFGCCQEHGCQWDSFWTGGNCSPMPGNICCFPNRP